MNDKLRQSIIGFIWPGPIAGPLPITLFRLLSPLLVFYYGSALAALFMGTFSLCLVVIYFELLQLAEGREKVEEMLQRLPKRLHKGIEEKGPVGLLVSSLLSGVFPYALSLKLLNYKEAPSLMLLAASAYLNSFLWTGIFWGFAIQLARDLGTFAF